MASPAVKTERFTYSDYLTWNGDERWEIIEGIPYSMSPAPNRRHQEFLGIIFNPISNYLKGKKCKVYVAPFDVRFAASFNDDYLIESVVQPDISVFCDEKKLDDRGAKGPPDWIIEILSPATASKDLHEKLLLYQKYGVKKYWIVNLELETISKLVLDKTGKYLPGKEHHKKEIISPEIFPELVFNLDELFNS